MSITCFRCKRTSLIGSRAARLGKNARFDLMICPRCRVSWYVRFDEQGDVLEFQQMKDEEGENNDRRPLSPWVEMFRHSSE